MVLMNIDKNTVLASRVRIAATFFSRFKGLMGRRKMLAEECLIIVPCNSIHTYFMNFPIDVLFLDSRWRVVKILEELEPWKVIPPVDNAKLVVELPGGISKKGLEVEVGDKLKLTA